ncbi:DNA polymerase IV [Williamsia sp.]|uniref:DNA polymerase IV n=1 Tax=Williamsia sp. TaxID=1872085 RepID=UPI0025FD9F25|nr:DNA polymerase IV [Williamsia sp.]
MSGTDDERGTRWVLHVDMDAFFASVEQLTRPTLRGRPVLVGGVGGRGVVAGASYEARKFGAHSAMPMHQARRMVGPGAVVVPPRGSIYRVVSVRVFSMIREAIPVIEMLSFDEAFGEPVHLAGATRAEVVEFAEQIRARIATLGLSASIGAGSGKQIAKIASGMAKPDGVTAVAPGAERDFLRPLSVRKLWGIGPVAGDRLHRLGIETIGELADLSTMEVSSVLGSTIGPALHRLANGIDDRVVAERSSAKQISAESTFADDVTSMDQLLVAIDRAAASAHRRLLDDGRGARTVVLKLKRSDMSILTRSTTTATATTDVAALTAAARRLALDPVDVGAIRLVGVGYSGLTSDEQFLLFTPGEESAEVATTDTSESDSPPDDASESQTADSSAQGVQTASGRTRDETGQVTWATGTDVRHPEFGHGWVQGSGHGVVSVRFETRATGPGPARTFKSDTPDLQAADPLDSLVWSARSPVS